MLPRVVGSQLAPYQATRPCVFIEHLLDARHVALTKLLILLELLIRLGPCCSRCRATETPLKSRCPATDQVVGMLPRLTDEVTCVPFINQIDVSPPVSCHRRPASPMPPKSWLAVYVSRSVATLALVPPGVVRSRLQCPRRAVPLP